jgi:hypothetical protein
MSDIWNAKIASNRLIKNWSWRHGMEVAILRVYDVVSRDKMACNHDIRERENSREQKFPTSPCFLFHLWNNIYFTYLIRFLTPCHWWFTCSRHTVQTTNTAKWGWILYHVHHVHTISGHHRQRFSFRRQIASRDQQSISRKSCDVVNVEMWRHVAHWPMTSLGVAWDVLCKLNNGHFLWRQIAVAIPWCLFSWKPSNRAFYGLIDCTVYK